MLGVQGLKGSRVLGFKGSRVQGLKGSRVQGLKGSRVQGFCELTEGVHPTTFAKPCCVILTGGIPS